MNYASAKHTPFPLFHQMLSAYYRDGDDAETVQSEIDGFVELLYNLCQEDKIMGSFAYDHDIPIGFVLYNLDTPNGAFNQKPGYGTILEIGVSYEFRGRGYGQWLVNHARHQLTGVDFYVCAYGPAEYFWEKCGFHDSGEIAENGLKIYVSAACGFGG